MGEALMVEDLLIFSLSLELGRDLKFTSILTMMTMYELARGWKGEDWLSEGGTRDLMEAW